MKSFPSRLSCFRLFLIGLAVLTVTQTTEAAAPLAPSHLAIDDAINPVGTRARPFFGWRVNDPDAGELQTRYHVRVASTAEALLAGRADIWDSGEVASRQQNHVAYAGPDLAGDRAYVWQVRTWDKDGTPGPFSAPARFVVGPLTAADWAGASWIQRVSDEPDDYTYYRQTVDLPAKPVLRATAYVTSVHKYELFLNGHLVGKGPAYQYPQYQYYNGFDVTALIRSGSNLFAVFNHWFGGGQGRATSARGVLMKTVIHYVDGTSVAVGTDGTWKQLRAPGWILGQAHRNRGEGVGYVERMDARLHLTAWHRPGFDDSGWAAAEVIGPVPTAPWVNVPQPDLTRIVEREIVPASVKRLDDKTWLVDLGKVWSGVPRVTFTGGEPGQLVTMLGGFGLGADGRVDPKQNQVTNLTFLADLDGKTFTYAPIEYIGFRYLQIENAPMAITPDNVRFVVRHSALDETLTTFSSANPTLDAVWDLMKHSLLVCAQEEYVDTPTREKGGFLGDAAIMGTVAMPVFGERLLSRRQMNELFTSMDQFWSTPDRRGRINAVYPNNDNGRDIPDYTQAFLVWIWDYYRETGDLTLLRERYAHLRSIAEYVYAARDSATGLIKELPGGGGPYLHGIIDWPASMRYGHDMDTVMRAVINHWAWADFDVMAKMAEAVGNTVDQDLYRQRADALKTAINTRLINASGVYVDGLFADGRASAHASQHANMFPLALGIVPPEHRASVIARVKELKMRVGMVTVLFLVRAVGESGDGPHLVDLFTDASWDAGWARILELGATATWESWVANTEANNSQSHAWGAAGLDGYVRSILGIRMLTPGYADIAIKPLDFGAKLPWARGNIVTDRGPVAVAWERSDGRYAMTVELPANVTSQVYVPRGAATDLNVRVNGVAMPATAEGDLLRIAIGSGTHTIERLLIP